MDDLFRQLSQMPFAPIVGWTTGQDGRWIAIGLGDLLVATVFPLVMRKAYGRAAGLTALAIVAAPVAAVFVVSALGGVRIFPVMSVLGPAMLLQYIYWVRRRGLERTTREYLAAEPRRGAQMPNLGRRLESG